MPWGVADGRPCISQRRPVHLKGGYIPFHLSCRQVPICPLDAAVWYDITKAADPVPGKSSEHAIYGLLTDMFAWYIHPCSCCSCS